MRTSGDSISNDHFSTPGPGSTPAGPPASPHVGPPPPSAPSVGPTTDGGVPATEAPAPGRSSTSPLLPTPARASAAVAHGALTYAVALAASTLTLVLVAVASVFSSQTSVTNQFADQMGVGQIEQGLLQILGLPFQLAGMAFLGILEGTLGVKIFGAGFDVGGRLWFAPLILTGCAATAAWLLGRRSERRDPTSTAAQRWLLAGLSGLVTAVLAVGLSAMFAVRFTDEASSFSLTAASSALFVGAAALTTLSSGAGRQAAAARRTRRTRPPVLGAAVAALQGAGWHYVLFVLPMGLVLVIAASTEVGLAALAGAPFWLGTIVSYVYGAAFLSPVTAEMSGESETLGIFDLPWWGTALTLLLFLIVTVIIGLLSARRGRRDELSVGVSWLLVPSAFLVLGVILTLMTRVSLDVVGVPALQGATVGLAPWTPLLFLVGGLLVEAVARFVAPVLLPLLPAAMLRRIGPATSGKVAVVPTGGGVPPLPDAAPAPAVVPHPMSARSRRRLILAGSITGVVLLGGIAAAVTIDAINSSTYGPDRQVDAYLSALSDGKAGAAADIVDPDVPTALRVLLTDEVFGAAGNRVTGHEIREVDVQGENATVTADVTQDGTTTTLSFSLRQDGRQNLVFDRWELAAPPAEWFVNLSVPEGAESVQVNGVDVTLPAEAREEGFFTSGNFVLPALPGTYEVTPTASSKYVTLGDSRAADVPVDPLATTKPLVFEQTATPALQEDAEARVMERLETCLSSTEAEPADCPNQAYVFGDADDIRAGSWSLDEQPTFTLSEGYEPGTYQLSSSNATATYTYEYNSAFGDSAPKWQDRDVRVSLYLRVPLTVDGDELVMDESSL